MNIMTTITIKRSISRQFDNGRRVFAVIESGGNDFFSLAAPLASAYGRSARIARARAKAVADYGKIAISKNGEQLSW